MKYQEVQAAARKSHGVIARSEIVKYVSTATFERWVANGILHVVVPRTFAFIPKPTWRQRVHAVCLACPELVVSHRTAARLWKIAPKGFSRLEFSSPTGSRRRLPDVRVHDTNCLPAEHRTLIDGTPITKPSRTIIDLSAVWSADLIQSTIGNALDRRLTTISELHRTLEDMRRRGRRRTTIIDEVLADKRYDDPKNGSELEREAMQLIRQAGLPLPIAQHAIPLEHITLHPDFCYPESRLAIELDGFDSHQTHFAFHDDRERDALLTIEGWHVIRFSKRTLPLLVPTISSYLRRIA